MEAQNKRPRKADGLVQCYAQAGSPTLGRRSVIGRTNAQAFQELAGTDHLLLGSSKHAVLVVWASGLHLAGTEAHGDGFTKASVTLGRD